jgi:peptidoglycan/LPS O-acetylase OafA/YrhL
MYAALSATWQLGYRPALDGLRGIAILLVIVHHVGVPGFAQTGYLGVTLFFVLSGFLITTLLEQERQQTGTVSLMAFYRRRAARLLPALFGFTIAVVTFLLVSGRSGEILGGAVPTLLYFADVARAGQAEMGLFDHSWSLAIEEQFYLVWPLLYVAVLWRSRRVAIAVLIALAVGSALWRLSLMDGSLFHVAFAPDTRADALLLGCALGLVATSRFGPPKVPGWLAVGAFLSVMILSMSASWRGILDALPLLTIASLGIIAWASVAPARLLTWGPFVQVGIISYGLYLWHVPILREGRRLVAGLPQALQIELLVAASIAVAAVSHRWIELPFMRRVHPSGDRHRRAAS